MIRINWNPLPHLGSLTINWYGLNWVSALVVGFILSPAMVRPMARTPNETGIVIRQDRRRQRGGCPDLLCSPERATGVFLASSSHSVWEGGLAYFGGLFGGIIEAYLWTRRHGVRFLKVADLFAPAIAIASAIGRISCWLAGMDMELLRGCRGELFISI